MSSKNQINWIDVRYWDDITNVWEKKLFYQNENKEKSSEKQKRSKMKNEKALAFSLSLKIV